MAKSKFLTEIREFMHLHGYSIRTEHTYIYWIRFCIHFHQLQPPPPPGARAGGHVSEFSGQQTGYIHQYSEGCPKRFSIPL